MWGLDVCCRMSNFSRQLGACILQAPHGWPGLLRSMGLAVSNVQLGMLRPKEGCDLLRAKT